MSAPVPTQLSALNEGYKYGFVTEIETEEAPPGLSEDTVRFISAKKGEPEWLLEWRLQSFRAWREMTPPEWAKVEFPPIDYQSASYYAAPKQQAAPKSLDEVDPELLVGAQDPGRGCGRCRVRQRLGRDDVQGAARGARH